MTNTKLSVIRAAILILAAALIALGALRGEPSEIMSRAVVICMECIGIG